MLDPVEALSSAIDGPYPQQCQTTGVRMTAAGAGTYLVIQQNPARDTLCITKLPGCSDCYVRPYQVPDGGGFALTDRAPNLVLDRETVGLYLQGAWWIQSGGSIAVWVFERVSNPQG